MSAAAGRALSGAAQEDAEDLSAAVRAHNEQLQTVGKPLLGALPHTPRAAVLSRSRARTGVLEELESTRGRSRRLRAAGASLDAALATLLLCQRAAAAIRAGQYYAALRLLERVRLERAPLLTALPMLRDHLQQQLPLAEAAVEEGAKALLDTWLADAAAKAFAIGRRAVAAAAAERAAVDARWGAQLAGVHACGGSGSAGQFSLLVEGGGGAEEDPLEGLQLARVATARHALAVLGREEAFWAHLSARRGAQLAALLAGGSGGSTSAEAFLEGYQSYFGAVCGFFVVEGHVARASGGGVTQGQLAAVWDRAAGALAGALSRHLPCCPSAPLALMLADYCHLLTAALRRLGLWTAALEASVHEAQERFHALAQQEVLGELTQALQRDAQLQALHLGGPGEYHSEVVALGLHPQGAPLPSPDDFPLLAPFTPLVPGLLRCVDTATADSCTFLGARGEEAALGVRRHRDALLARVTDELLAPQLAGTRTCTQLVQLAGNAAALESAADWLDERLAQRCHVAPERAAALQLQALAEGGRAGAAPRVLRAFREHAEEALLRGLTAQVDAFFAAAPLEDWLPDAPRTAPREAAHASAAFLAHALGEAVLVLAPPSAARLARAAAGRASDALLAPLTREGGDGRRFSVHGLAGLRADVQLLEATAQQQPLPDLASAFAEPRQLCALFAGDALEALAGPGCEQPQAFRAALQRDFFALAPARLALLLERYREPPGPGLLHRGAAPPMLPFPKRKAVAVVVDRLNAAFLRK